MSYGHCIVLPNQNRDTVQIISVQDKAALKEYKCGKLHGTTRFQMGNTGIHVQQHYWLYCDATMWKSTVYRIEIEINRAIDKSKPVKETCVNIPAMPLEFRLDPSILNKFVWVNTVIQEQSSMHDSNHS